MTIYTNQNKNNKQTNINNVRLPPKRNAMNKNNNYDNNNSYMKGINNNINGKKELCRMTTSILHNTAGPNS